MAGLQPHSLRANQIDAVRLDDEVHSMLRQQVAEAFAPWSPISVDQVRPEVDAALRLAIWRHSFWRDAASPGGLLQNVVYVRAESTGKLTGGQKLAALFIHVILPWIVARGPILVEQAEQSSRTDRLSKLVAKCLAWRQSLMPKLVSIYAVLAVAHFGAFLRWGTYSTISDRLVGIRMVHLDATAQRQTSFQFLTRAMLWNALSEVLMIIVPLIDLGSLQRMLTRETRAVTPARSNAELECVLCGTSAMVSPMRSNCGHMFCYFCVASALMEDYLKCPHCKDGLDRLDHAA